MDELLQQLDNLARSDWLNTAVSVVVILGITAVAASLITHFLRRMLHFNEEKNLPSSSIFVNIGRGAVWALGICIMLSTSFNVDVSAAVTALGIGGIAISLGFQDTISNLIGGLQLSLLRIVKPGDNIEVGSESGVVRDVLWRHTVIRNAAGEEILIPNSIINKTTLVHLPPPNQTSLSLEVTTDGAGLTQKVRLIEAAAAEAACGIGKVKKEPALLFSEITGTGFKGSLAFSMADARDVAKAKDAVLRAVAPLTRGGAGVGGAAGEDAAPAPAATADVAVGALPGAAGEDGSASAVAATAGSAAAGGEAGEAVARSGAASAVSGKPERQ